MAAPDFKRVYAVYCDGCMMDMIGTGPPLYCPECERLNRPARFSLWARLWRLIRG